MPEPRGRLAARLFGEDGRELAWVGVCDTARSRRRGLLGIDVMPPDECILLTPCRAVHTLGMKMPIDVAFLDGELRVVALRPGLPPGKLMVTRRLLSTKSVLEAAAGAFTSWGVRVGERLRLEAE